MKKLLLFLVLLAIVAAAIWVSLGQRVYQGTSKVIGASPVGETGRSAYPSNSILASLGEQNFAVAALQPGNFQSAVKWYEDLRTRLQNTAAWKKLDVEKLINEATAEANTDAQALGNVGGQLAQIWSGTEEIIVSVSKRTFKPAEKLELPSVLIKARFSAKEHPQRLREYLDKEVLKGADQYKDDKVSVSKVSNGRYSINMEIPDGKANGGIQFTETSVAITIGSVDEGPFSKDASAGLLVESDGWKEAAQGFMPSSAALGYLDARELSRLMTLLAQALPQDPVRKAASDASIVALRDIMNVGASFGFGDGILGRQCVKLQTSANALKYTSEGKDGSKNFLSAVTPQTILAVRALRDSIQGGISMLRDSYVNSAAMSPEQSQAWQPFLASLERIQKLLSDLPYEEVGVVANSSVAAMAPEAGIIFRSESGFSVDQIQSWLESVVKEVSSLGLPAAQVSRRQSETGREILTVAVDPQTSLSAGLANKNVLVVALNDAFIDSLSKALSAEPAVLSENVLKPRGMNEALLEADLFYYLSLKPLVEMGRPFIPFLFMARPDIQLSNQEIDELLQFIQVSYLLAQKNTKIGAQTICSDSRALAL